MSKKTYCKQKYIGETDRELREKISEHRGYIHNKKLTQATGAYFNLPGHSLSDMKVTILEKTRRGSPVDRRPSTAEAPPKAKIHPFSKMAVTVEPLMRF